MTRGYRLSYICRTIHNRTARTAKLSTSGNASVSAFCELLSPFIDKFSTVLSTTRPPLCLWRRKHRKHPHAALRRVLRRTEYSHLS
nr:MAG TPA: hypothetical protein [Caudoviricetes sp.]